jgi:hypothetical protein
MGNHAATLPAYRAETEANTVGLDYQPRHSAHETVLVYVESREDGFVTGEVIRGSGNRAEAFDFEVEDNEPDDVWGPICGRILEHIGLSYGPDNYDQGEVGHPAYPTGHVREIDIRHEV